MGTMVELLLSTVLPVESQLTCDRPVFAFRIPRELRVQINCFVYLYTSRLNSRFVPPLCDLGANLHTLGICNDKFRMLLLT